ncbi:MAG: DUF2877 domain-containing protein [Anaerolineales bacterium]|nr:DUF2877 domain-containing protein [Anaerolineales bacterium]
MFTLTAVSMTPAARAWLAQSRPAQVLNVFDRACNLVDAAGEVMSMVTNARGLTPFGLVVAPNRAGSFKAVTVESQVVRAPPVLRVGPLRLDYAGEGVRTWDPRPSWSELRICLDADPGRLDALVRLVADRALPGSLLDLFLVAADRSPLPPGLFGRARAGVDDLATGLLTGQLEQAAIGGQCLAGLGAGLTPAGDDFVVGACLASWAGLYGPAAPDLGAVVGRAVAPLTSTLSAAYVRAASQGECALPWHTLFSALCQPDSSQRQADLAAAVDAVLSVGHTSGADGLAGFLALHFLKSTINWPTA